MDYLFVGGPKHGQFVSVPYDRDRTVVVPDYPERMTAAWDYSTSRGPGWDTPTFSTATYERRDIGTNLIVYVCTRGSGRVASR